MEDYTFRRSYLTLFFAGLFFAFCGVAIFFLDMEDGGGGRRAAFIESIPYAKEIMLVCCAIFVGVCLVVLITGRPTLIANREGFTFTNLAGKSTHVTWDSVQSVDLNQHFIIFHYFNGQKITKLNVGGMFKLKPQKMLEKLGELRG